VKNRRGDDDAKNELVNTLTLQSKWVEYDRNQNATQDQSRSQWKQHIKYYGSLNASSVMGLKVNGCPGVVSYEEIRACVSKSNANGMTKVS
jgi:hypothetical protein